MLRGLLHEIVRRRLWPIPVLAIAVAIAAPLLFLKSSPDAASLPAQGSQATVDPGVADGLPVRARRLLRTKADRKRAASRRPKAADPFQAPSSARKSKTVAPVPSETGSGPASSGAPTEQKPVPVVITDENGKTPTGTTGETSAKSSAESSKDARRVAVDVRFAPSKRGAVRRDVPRLKALTAKGRIVASFVKYSPTRNRAVFAISPNTLVSGSVECRREDGLCRYVELKAGQSVRLTIIGPDGAALVRRLGVVRIHSLAGAPPEPPLAGSCLLTMLRKLGPGDPAVRHNACD